MSSSDSIVGVAVQARVRLVIAVEVDAGTITDVLAIGDFQIPVRGACQVTSRT